MSNQGSEQTKYEYLTADGRHYCTVTRTAEKDFFTEPRGLKGPHPLYRVEVLSGVSPDSLIIVTEGERDVHTLEALGLVAVTNKGGSNAVKQTDWSSLERFRKIVKFTDNDDAGRKHTETVVTVLGELPGSRQVITVSFPELPEKGDVSDWLEKIAEEIAGANGKSVEVCREKLLAYIEEHGNIITPGVHAAPNSSTEGDVSRLIREIPSPERYPLDVLPDVLHNAIGDVVQTVQVPVALAAQSFLAAAALAVQAHGHVLIDGRILPTSLYCLSVCDSGDRKSAVDKVVLRPHREWQQEQFREYETFLVQYKREEKAYKSTVTKAIGKAGNGNYAATLKAVENVGEEPVPPLIPVILITNMTSEALNQQLNIGLPYAGVFSDESGSLIGGYSMSKDHLLKTLSDFSSLWGGSDEIRVRVGSGLTNTQGKRLSMHLMAQPDVARILLGKRIAHTQGFFPRLLICWPETLRGTRKYQRRNLEDEASIQEYNARILDILNTEPVYSDTRKLCLNPRNVPLSKDAYEHWVAFHDKIESQNNPDGPLDAISGWASKAAEHAARIAGVLALLDDLYCQEIPVEYMMSGATLAEFYLHEMYRVHAQGEQDESTLRSDKLLQFMQEKRDEVNNVFSSEYLLQYGPKCIRDAVTLQDTLELLKEMDKIERVKARGKKWGLP